MQIQKQESGVSPVIGIILMVAVTVGLVALASTIVFDLGNNVQEPADVSTNLNFDEGNSEISAEVIRNENADNVSLRMTQGDVSQSSPDETTKFDGGGYATITTGEGSTGTLNLELQSSKSGVAEVVAIVDENEQVIDTVEYDTN